MKIGDFITEVNKNRKILKLQSIISVKKYLPFEEKLQLIDDILEQCKIENDGYIKFDEIKKYILFTVKSIQTYTNLEFDADMSTATKEYDMLYESGLLDEIIGTFSGEYKTVLDLMQMRAECILLDNSIECQLAKFLSKSKR
jgi:hypothetical protein